MRLLSGFSIALLFSTGMVAQNRSGFVAPMPGSRPSFGSVVFPGGTSALPGVQRTTGSVVHPGGGFPQIGVPGLPFQTINGQNGARGFRRNFNNGSQVVAYPVAVPVYMGGYGYDPSMYYGAQGAPQQQQAPPNVIVVYPPAPAPPSYAYMPPMQSNMVEVPPQQQMQQAQPEQPEANHFLLAFKDHSIYSALAYWVDGDTLHYFTSGNTHNQVSLSLVDRDLTKRLNEGSGLEVKLPAPK